MKTPAYTCKQCSMAVIILPDGQRIWACPHEGGTIIANCEAHVTATGGVKEE